VAGLDCLKADEKGDHATLTAGYGKGSQRARVAKKKAKGKKNEKKRRA